MDEGPRDVLPLLGYMDEQTARSFIVNDCVTSKSGDEVAALVKETRAAVLRKPVPNIEARTRDLPAEAEGILSQVKNDERFPRTVGKWSWSFKELEIDRLLCVQRYIDLPYVEEISQRLDPASLESRIRFCLTDAFRTRDSEIFEVPNEHFYAVRADGYDLRVMKSWTSLDPTTRDRTVSFTVGWGHPYVQVARLRGRYVLKNGYHRAFALKRKGIDYLPCILIEASSYDDLECTGPPTFFSERSIMGAHPPVFSAFVDPEISPPMRLKVLVKAVVIRPDTAVLESIAMERYLDSERSSLPKRPESLEYIDIRPTHEDWNAYRLADGTTLKLRAVLTRVKRQQPNGARGNADISSIMLVCNPPKGTKGKPSQTRPTPEELTAAIVDPDIRFKTISEPMNEYVTEDGRRMILKLKLYNLAKTNRYDPNGDPLYLFNAKPELIMLDP